LTALGILTTSNWNTQYYNAAADFGPGIVFYYIAWIFIGNWVLFNMFVAILIQGISEEKKNKFRRQEELVAEGIKAIFFGLSEEALVYKVEVLFKEADNDNSGHIDMNELEGILVKHCKVDMGPRELIRLFRKYDDDDSGKINLEEFENMIKELLQISKETLRKLLLKTIKEIFGSLPEDSLKAKTIEMFHKADQDGSGLIDEVELKALLSEHDIELMPTDLTRLLTKFGDHGGDRISEKGFTQMIKQLLEEAMHEGHIGGRESRPPRASLVADFAAAVITGKRTQTAPAPPLAEFDDPPAWSHEEHRKKEDDAPNGDLNTLTMMERVDAESSLFQAQERPVLNKAAESTETPAEANEDHRNEKHGSNGIITREAVPASNNAQISVAEEESQERAKRSLFIFSLTNPFRRNCIRILEYPPNVPDSGKYFDNFILLCIVLSSCSLAFEHPRIGTGSSERISLDRLNIFLNLAFLCECCLKIVADSFAGYLKSGWSRLDFFIVVTSTVDMTMTYLLTGQNVSLLKTFRILRILRALRPLRLIARARSLRLLISALWSSIIPILGTCSIALLAYAMCALLGMQLLRGKMKSCSDPRFISKSECLGNFDESGAHLQWLSYPVNWDNLYNGIVAMFILSSQDNWQVHMVRFPIHIDVIVSPNWQVSKTLCFSGQEQML
jgi:Ca2+-binding EF-hand superfamily protein